MSRKKPEIEQINEVARSRLFRIEEVHLKFSNGERRIFERLKPGSRGAVMIVPINDKKEILLIREYAAGVDSYELALPKGLVEPDETPEQAANRELKEEVGFGARHLKILKQVSLAPGYLSHRMNIVFAYDLYPEKLEGDEPEPIEVVPTPVTEIDQLIYRDDFSEARSIVGLMLARDYLREIGEL